MGFVLQELKDKKKSIPSNWIARVTGIDEEEVNERLEEMAKLKLVRKTTTKMVRFWSIQHK